MLFCATLFWGNDIFCIFKFVLKNPDVKNSWVREYLPDKDLMKIQEDENQQHQINNSTENKIILPRLFNPSTT